MRVTACNMWLRLDTSNKPEASLLERSVMEGENPVHTQRFVAYGSGHIESRSLGKERKRVVDSI